MELAEQGGSDTTLDDAIEAGRQAAELTAAGSGARVAATANLALALWARADQTGSVDDLIDTVGALRGVCSQVGDDDPDFGRHANNLGLALREQFLATGELGALTASVEVLRRAHAAVVGTDVVGTDVVGTDPEAVAIASNLALALQDWCERTGEVSALDEAIDLLTSAIRQTPPQGSGRADYLSNVSAMYQDLYEWTGDAAALAPAVQVARESLRLTMPENPHRPARLTHLGLALRLSYEASGDMAQLVEAIDASREAVRAAGPGHRRAGIYLSNLGNALRLHYEQTGATASLEQAVSAIRRAVAASRDDDPRRASYQSNLALALWTRFDATGDLSTLDEAIDMSRAAVAATAADHPDRHRFITNLGLALWTRDARQRAPQLLAEALALLTEVLDATAANHADHARFAANLSNALRSRYQDSGAPADADAAIDAARDALSATPADHVDRANRLSNLGAVLLDRYQGTAGRADLDEAVEVLGAAVSLTAAGNLDRGLHLLNLGEALVCRHDQAPDEVVRVEALAVLTQAAEDDVAPISLRIEATWMAGRLAAAAGDWNAAAGSLAFAVAMLPRVAPRHLHSRDQEHRLGRFLGMVSDAAACALNAGDPQLATVLLERGRGILLGQVVEPGVELAELRRMAPDLAERFEWLRRNLDGLAAVGPPDVDDDAGFRDDVATRRDRRHSLAGSWEPLLDEIRARDGLSQFMRPTELADLSGVGVDGPVVVVNMSRYRCDAIIVSADHMVVAPLPSLTVDQAATQAAAFQRTLDSGSAAGPPWQAFFARFTEVVDWLWQAVVAPVLTELAKAGGAHPARLWWSPTGVLATLPLHVVALHHEPDSAAADIMMSYTPTLRSLQTARRVPRSAEPDSVLVVSHGDHLPATAAETSMLLRTYPDATLLAGDDATRARVTDALCEASIVHFATHAISDPVTSSDSHLGLSDQPLAVAGIAALHVHRPWLAYLSACETAQPGSSLPDEALHPAAAFYLAGYPHVVATLWPVPDRTAATIATAFYEAMVATGTTPGVALHQTVRRMHAAQPSRPMLWAAHVHVGG